MIGEAYSLIAFILSIPILSVLVLSWLYAIILKHKNKDD
jgi:hypothetical protein